MFRIDTEDYTVLYVEYGDHLHRYAVPVHWTVDVLANHIVDSFDIKPNHRKGDTEVLAFHGTTGEPLWARAPIASILKEDGYVVVIRKDKVRS